MPRIDKAGVPNVNKNNNRLREHRTYLDEEKEVRILAFWGSSVALLDVMKSEVNTLTICLLEYKVVHKNELTMVVADLRVLCPFLIRTVGA